MQNNPKISVIIPIYNADKYLDRCLKSVQEQTYTNFEVILIDDGSPDSSKKIYDTFITSDIRFKCFFQENKGPSSARNLGLDNSSGLYIAFIDADDYIDKTYLEDLIRPIIKHKAQLACCAYYELSKFNKKPYPVNDFKECRTLITKDMFIPKLFAGTAGVLWGKLFSNEIIKKNQLQLAPAIKMSEDLIFVLEYVLSSDKIAIVNKHNYFYNRLNERGLSANQDYSYLNYLKLTNNAIDNILQQYKYSIPTLKNFKRNRLWSLVKMLTYKTAVSKEKLKAKQEFINQVLNEDFVENNINSLRELNKFYAPLLFLLKKKYIILFINYSKLLKFFLDFKLKKHS